MNCDVLVAGAFPSGIASGPRLGGNSQGRGEGNYVEVPRKEDGLTDGSHIFDRVIGHVDVYGCGL
ncbi:hypothetical protein P0O24_00075 [Methanotrichaceae archaeon M04Ac]|uniref:Uncharacterized protein n=1 Tax=Candidatus Methanocrinis alkalitolerans TaxID=3033395 RepID=A0ABT5XBB4_9EURY|nr:hypothetical protein [Candidatus Methanocrinis alkalitolerans]